MLAGAGTAGIGLFVACCVAMHLIQPDLSIINDVISYYMNGRLGWALGLGLVALGAGSLSIAYGLRLLPAHAGGAGFWLLAIWGVGAVVGGLFPPDPRGSWNRPPTVSGMIHGNAAMAALLALPIGSLLLSRSMARMPDLFGELRFLKVLAWLSSLSVVAFSVCLAPVFAKHAPYKLGLVERLLMAFYTAWLLSAGRAVSRAARLGKSVGG